MNLENIVEVLEELYEKLAHYSENELEGLALQAERQNPWFTKNNFLMAYKGVLRLIDNDSLIQYKKRYETLELENKTIGLVLAGNIPAVGFHDILICLLAGCEIKVKLSSDDSVFPTFLINELKSVNSELGNRVIGVEKLVLDDVDAVIATGSDNTARYFEQYFSKKPNVIRKSRTSVAVLDGTETEEELRALTDDVFQYFGLGCRNVSKILTLKDTDLMPFLGELEKRKEFNDFSKYDNNYLYYKSIYLVNREEFLDTESILIKESEDLSSPISVLYYQRFNSHEEIESYLKLNDEKIQCIVGKEQIPFGGSQSPNI